MLKIISNRLKPINKIIIAHDQAGFKGRTTEQIFNLRILSETFHQDQQDICLVFVDIKEGFN